MIAQLAIMLVTSIVGAAYYAMPKFTPRECTKALSVYENAKTPAVTTLWGSFGSDLRCFNRFIDLATERGGGVALIHPTNNTCKRSPRWCTSSDMPSFGRRVREISDFIQVHESDKITWLVSLGLEDDKSATIAMRDFRTAKRFLPSYVSIVRNPADGKGLPGLTRTIEHHGLLDEWKCKGARVCVFSNDGGGYDPSSRTHTAKLKHTIRAYNRTHRYQFVWWGRSQGLPFKSGRNFVEPRKRTLDIRSADIRVVRKLLRDVS